MRECGVLMHITSLPGPYGVGTMGKEAFRFVDFLKEAGQSYWQILPLSPTGYGDSPYQSCSTYAGNPYLIDLDTLIGQGLLRQQEVAGICWFVREDKVDFGLLYNHKNAVLRLAYGRFAGGEEFDRFCHENSGWLSDFALFMALKDAHGGKPWYQWPEPLKYRHPDAIRQARQELKDSIRFYSFVQYLFFGQWNDLRSYAAENGIRFIGDVPIYVPWDSVDVWANPELFQLDETLTPTAVAGCPPDAFTADGQLWGNPLYRWDVLQSRDYGWWLSRLAAAGRLYDVVRIDHFRGFESYWAVPFGEATARNGKWIKGPGLPFIRRVQEALPHIRLIAEDLGFLTQEVLDLRDDAGLPGMRVLGFAFYTREDSEYLPQNYIRNCVCYTGTHDNMTMRQWFDTAEPDSVAYAKEYMALTEEEGLVWGVIRTAYASVAELCVVQLQDFLDLGGDARMNFPGTLTDLNWTWRLKGGIISQSLAKKIRKLACLYNRLGKQTRTGEE